MRQVPLSPLSFDPQRVANVPEHPPPSTRLRSCADIANRRLSRIIGARKTLRKPSGGTASSTRYGKSRSFLRPTISRLRRVILPNPLRPRASPPLPPTAAQDDREARYCEYRSQ